MDKTTDNRMEIKNLFNKYSELMEHNTRGAQIGAYSLAIMGFSIALRKVRPFSKFSNSTQIPNSYIKQRIEIKGIVERIEPKQAALLVNHKPLVPLPFRSSENLLPVKIANVQVSSLGMNWLQAIVAGNEITIVPLSKHPHYIFSEVILSQKEKASKTVNTMNIGESLITVGFGKFVQQPEKVNDVMHKIYIDKLKYAEERAMKKELGFKYYLQPVFTYFLIFLRSSVFLLRRILLKSVRLALKQVSKAKPKEKKAIV